MMSPPERSPAAALSMGSELVLALADLGENLRLRPALHAEPLLNRRDVRAEEGVGVQLQADGGGERRLAGGTLLIDLPGALLQSGAVRLDGEGEPGVGLRVLVPAVDGGILRQRHQL